MKNGWAALRAMAALTVGLSLAGCGDPISAQIERDQRQDTINAAGSSGCPEGYTYYPGAGGPWYAEPTPGDCLKD